MEFRIGDIVQIAIPSRNNTRYDRGGVTNDDIGVIIEIKGDRLRIYWLTGTYKKDLSRLWSGAPYEMKHAVITNRQAIQVGFLLR